MSVLSVCLLLVLCQYVILSSAYVPLTTRSTGIHTSPMYFRSTGSIGLSAKNSLLRTSVSSQAAAVTTTTTATTTTGATMSLLLKLQSVLNPSAYGGLLAGGLHAITGKT